MNFLLRKRRLGNGSCTGIREASTRGFTVIRNWLPEDWREANALIGDGRPVVFRWGCTSTLEGALHDALVVNPAKAIHWCGNKKQGRLDMQAAGVPVPWTRPIVNGVIRLEDDDGGDGEGLIKLVARPTQHAQGKNLVVGTYQQWARRAPFTDGYVSHLIDKVAEYRVMVIQGRVAWVARKTPGNPEDVAWNVARGGRFDNVRWNDWPMPVISAALAAAKAGELDFGGIDVMTDADGKAYVLEANSAPSQTSPYRQACVAKCFDYIASRGDKTHFPELQAGQRLTWKSVIHPAVQGDNN